MIEGAKMNNWLRALIFLASAGIVTPIYAAPVANLSVTIIPSSCRSDGTAGGQTMNYANGTGTSTLYWNDCRQVIDGWGADGYKSSSDQQDYTSGDLDLLFTLNNGGIGLNLMRMDTGWDQANNNYDLTISNCPNMSGAASRGALVFSTQSGVSPTFLTGTELTNLSGFATWLTQWIQAVQSQCGVTVYAASVQNEPNIPYFTWPNGSTSIHDFILNNLGPDFVSAGLSTTIAIPEEDGWDFSWAAPTMADPSAAGYVGVLFVHYAGTAYGDPVSPYTYENLGLHLWHTESNSPDTTDFNNGVLFNLQSIHEYLVDGNANGYNFQQGEIIDAAEWGNGGLLNDHVPSKMFYGLGQWSSYVRPGWHLYGATEYPDGPASCNSTVCTGVSVSFYRSPGTNDFAVIAVNNNGSDTSVNLSFNGFGASSVTPVITSASLNMAQQSSVSAGSGFSYTLPAQSVTTFVGTAN